MAESGFVIDGVTYEVPTLDSFKMREIKVLYDCSGLSLEDFAVDEDDPEGQIQLQRNRNNPGFWEAMFVVAYMRGNPGTSLAKAKGVVEESNFYELLSSLVGGDDDDPPAVSGISPERPADDAGPISTLPARSGETSKNGSDAQAVSPKTTGTSVSDTSHISAPPLSEIGSQST